MFNIFIYLLIKEDENYSFKKILIFVLFVIFIKFIKILYNIYLIKCLNKTCYIIS